MSDLPFAGRVALVLGASLGIGAATARRFAALGASVVVGARSEERLTALVEEIGRDGGEALAVRCDVRSDADVAAIVDATVSAYGRLDVAFNNADQHPPPAPLHEIDVAGFDDGLATSLRGTFVGMRHEVPAMLATGGGAVVNMASMAGVQGTAGMAPYVAAKAGVIGLTRAAALDYADRGIRVNVVAPGPILTHHLARAGERAQQGAAQGSPMRRVGTEQEVAQVVTWLCSDDASYVTGVVVPIDGGQSAGRKPPTTYRQGEPLDP